MILLVVAVLLFVVEWWTAVLFAGGSSDSDSEAAVLLGLMAMAVECVKVVLELSDSFWSSCIHQGRMWEKAFGKGPNEN